jgi:hypothetical protein
MNSTIPAPGPDTSQDARSASVPRALCARLKRNDALCTEAARLASGEPRDADKVPDSAARAADERAASDPMFGAE